MERWKYDPLGSSNLAPEPFNAFNFSPNNNLEFSLTLAGVYGLLNVQLHDFTTNTFDVHYFSLVNSQTNYSGVVTAGDVYQLSVQAVGGGGYPNAAGGTSTFTLTATPIAVPEPSSLALLGLGVIGMAFGAYRRCTAA